jgi:hypothetical protein
MLDGELDKKLLDEERKSKDGEGFSDGEVAGWPIIVFTGLALFADCEYEGEGGVAGSWGGGAGGEGHGAALTHRRRFGNTNGLLQDLLTTPHDLLTTYSRLTVAPISQTAASPQLSLLFHLCLPRLTPRTFSFCLRGGCDRRY